MEAEGRWPDRLKLIHVVFLPKPDGGWRPIMIDAALYRMWARVRLHYVNQWELVPTIGYPVIFLVFNPDDLERSEQLINRTC